MIPVSVAILALVTAGVLYQRIAGRRRQIPPPGFFIEAGLHRLHVRCAGEGAPFVLLEAGVAASSLGWSRVQPDIARFTRVCAYDRAGLAWSDRASSPRTFTLIVDELTHVLAHVAAEERCILVGHSFGSFVVRAYAARHPERIVGLVLVDPPTEWLSMTPQRRRLLRRGQRLSRVGAVLAELGIVRGCLMMLTGGAPGAPRRFVKVFGPAAAGTLKRLVGEVKKLPSDVHPMVREHWCQPKCFHSMADHLMVLERDGAVIAAAQPPATIPTVVISGGNHTAEEIAEHRALAARSSAGRHIVASRSTHWVQFDEPELIVEAVQELAERGAVVESADGVAR